MDKKIRWSLVFPTVLTVIRICFGSTAVHAQGSENKVVKNDVWTLEYARYGLSGIWRTGDTFATNYIRKGHCWGDLTLRYRLPDGRLDSVRAAAADSAASSPLRIAQSFRLDRDSLTWTITLDNHSAYALRIEDLAIPFYYNSGGGENPREIFEQRVVKHHFIAGNNSFLFWERPTGLGPYLVMVPLPGTSLEYFSTNVPGETKGVFQVFIHSARTGRAETRGTWRQPHSAVTLPAGSQKSYGFKFRWARDYQQIRDILNEEGGIDVQVMPGMTVPNDLDARLALRTRQTIDSIIPEFPQATTIRYLREQAGYKIYDLHFNHPGENRLTIRYGGRYTTYLEYFSTQPLETLYKKRAAFIVNRQQHKDPSKWYDGLFSIYDMKHHQLRGPDNADYFDTSRLSYVLTCDDPGLCKAPYLAAKNCYYPDSHEIAAIEYYIQHFVWGKLQRTDTEMPNPYGVYGTPNWKVNRDTLLRKANINDRNKDKMHIWRSYDYPHIMMLYYHMYQIASMYPGMTHYLDKKGYLIRAKETARAYFTYPYEILPWYETYKWGCYNELLLTDLMADLEKEGYADDAAFLRKEWEKKVKYFLYDDPYPFRSEYAIDATAFESSHALAKYAMQHTLQPDSNLWYDKNLQRWYSHPLIKKEDAGNFMERQMAANIALRGAIEPAYYYLGSDFRGRSDNYTLSYMSQMGGWAILDYALQVSHVPADYIRLGYASYLSSFALINAGTAANHYGFWYPGKDNDGASGWAFEPQKFTIPWIQKEQGRGPWYYDGEIDLGFGGATRMAATIVTDDPIFGLVAYGGKMVVKNNTILAIPRDGLRRRFYYRGRQASFDLELSQDGFAKDQSIRFDTAAGSIVFGIENRSGKAHTMTCTIRGLEGAYRLVTGADQQTEHRFTTDGKPRMVVIPIGTKGLTRVQFIQMK